MKTLTMVMALITLSACGSDGRNGLDGQSLVGPKGDAGESVAGPQGLPGTAGPTGPAGPNGLPGTAISSVKFCPSATSQWPEYGLCIGNKLYAIFNQADKLDYLTEIRPGSYQSIVTGASCTFTVQANCVVVN